MNSDIYICKHILIYFLVVILCCINVSAQNVRAGGRRATSRDDNKKEKQVLKVRRFTGLGKQSFVKTPEYRTNIPNSGKPDKEWWQVVLTYDTYPDWIDGLTFQYYVLLVKTQKKKKHYNFFKKVIKYKDIEKGRDHKSTVFLHSKALKRYGSPVAVAVEISYKSKVIDSTSEQGKSLPRGKWWKNPAVVESKSVTVRDGYLLDRSESPYALININDYEVIK